MNYEVIKSRHSVRSYTNQPLPTEIRHVLTALIDECNSNSGLHMQLVCDEPKAFGSSLLARYGKFSNVCNYICMIGKKCSQTEELLGYYGEKLVLKAQESGLNTCWVGMSSRKGKIPADISNDEKLYAVIAIGYGTTQGVAHKIKTAKQICPEIDSAPEWFRRGVEYALLAPTAVNQQKFRFKWSGENRVEVNSSWGFFSKMDLGIARLHFELGAYPIKVEWVQDAN